MRPDEYLAFSNFNKIMFLDSGPHITSLTKILPHQLSALTQPAAAEVAEVMSQHVEHNINFFPDLYRKAYPNLTFNEILVLCKSDAVLSDNVLERKFSWNWFQVDYFSILTSVRPHILDWEGTISLMCSAMFFDLILLRSFQKLISLRNTINLGPRSSKEVSHITFDCMDATIYVSDAVIRTQSLCEKVLRAFFESGGVSAKFTTLLTKPNQNFLNQHRFQEEYSQCAKEIYDLFGNLRNDELHRVSKISLSPHDQDAILKSIDDAFSIYKSTQAFITLCFAMMATRSQSSKL